MLAASCDQCIKADTINYTYSNCAFNDLYSKHVMVFYYYKHAHNGPHELGKSDTSLQKYHRHSLVKDAVQ